MYTQYDATGGRVAEMCVSALVQDWVSIWNPYQYVDLFRVADAEEREVCQPSPPRSPPIPPFPVNQPAPGEMTPEPGEPPDLPNGLTCRMIKGCSNVPAIFPITSHDDFLLPRPASDPLCWDLRCLSFSGDAMKNGPEGPVDYKCGPLDTVDCLGLAKHYDNLAVDLWNIVYGAMLEQWTTDQQNIFGHIIADGDRRGWYELPARHRMVIITEHSRYRLSKKVPGGSSDQGFTNRPPPPWPFYDSPNGKAWYSRGQNIKFIAIGFVEYDPVDNMVPISGALPWKGGGSIQV